MAVKKKTRKRPAKKKVAKKRVQKKTAKRKTKKVVRKKMGRPTKYTPAVAARICSQLAQGKSMRTVCKDSKLPSMQTVFTWLRDKPDFLEQYEKAKDESADVLVEEILEIADDSTNDYISGLVMELDPDMRICDLDENQVLLLIANAKKEGVQRSRLRVDARKWIASKLKPRKYGDKLELGTDPDAPPVVRIERKLV